MKYRKKPYVIEAITFREFVEYGKNNSTNIVNDMPWSFEYNGCHATHENDKCYLISTVDGVYRFTPDDMLITWRNSKLLPCSINNFNNEYKAIDD